MTRIKKSGGVSMTGAFLVGWLAGCGTGVTPTDRHDAASLDGSHQVSGSDQSGEMLPELMRLLADIENVSREERISRWCRISELSEQSSDVGSRIRQMADGGAPTRYQQFIAAATVAGFGFPTRIGPNALEDFPLGRYVGILRTVSVPIEKQRQMRVAKDIENLRVTVPANENDDLYFHEILWIIIESYSLDFRTEPDGTFLVVATQRA
jgi:hypothetical protein